MFWQLAKFIKWERRFAPLFFDWKQKRIKNGRRQHDQQKILEIAFLGKFLICKSKTDKIKCPETFKAENNVD